MDDDIEFGDLIKCQPHPTSGVVQAYIIGESSLSRSEGWGKIIVVACEDLTGMHISAKCVKKISGGHFQEAVKYRTRYTKYFPLGLKPDVAYDHA